MSASIWKKGRSAKRTLSDLHPRPPPAATAAPFLPVASPLLLPFVHIAFTIPEGSCMSQKTDGTSVTSLSHSQSLHRPSQIKTVVTVPRASLYRSLAGSVY